MGLFSTIGNFLSAPLKALNPNNYLNGNPVKNIFGSSGKLGLGKPDGSNLDFLEMIPFLGEGITAQKNRQAQQEANQLNYQMFQEQNAFNEEQARLAFQRESAFNSEQAQVARLKLAGINPATAFGQSSTASAPAASSGSPIPMEAATSDFSPTRAFDATMSGITQGQNLKAIAETIDGLHLDNESKNLFNQILKDTLQFQKDTIYWNSQQVKESVRKMSEEASSIAYDREYKKTFLDLQGQIQQFAEKQWQDQLEQFKETNKVAMLNAKASVMSAKAALMQGKISEKQLDFQKEQAKREYLRQFNERLATLTQNMRENGFKQAQIDLAKKKLQQEANRDYMNFISGFTGKILQTATDAAFMLAK